MLSAPRDEQALGRARARGHRHARLSRRSSRGDQRRFAHHAHDAPPRRGHGRARGGGGRGDRLHGGDRLPGGYDDHRARSFLQHPRAAEVSRHRPERERRVRAERAAHGARPPGRELSLPARRAGGIFLPRRRHGEERRIRAARARRRGGTAAGGDRKRRRHGKGLRFRARLLPRQPRRAVLFLQRPPHPLARFAGRAGAGIQKYRHGRQVSRVRALYHAAQRSCGRERPSDEGGGKVRKRKARF